MFGSFSVLRQLYNVLRELQDVQRSLEVRKPKKAVITWKCLTLLAHCNHDTINYTARFLPIDHFPSQKTM